MTHTRFLYLTKCKREGSDSVIAHTLEWGGSREKRAEVLLGDATEASLPSVWPLAGAHGYTEERVQI